MQMNGASQAMPNRIVAAGKEIPAIFKGMQSLEKTKITYLPLNRT
jgi:hypothetical protein